MDFSIVIDWGYEVFASAIRLGALVLIGYIAVTMLIKPSPEIVTNKENNKVIYDYYVNNLFVKRLLRIYVPISFVLYLIIVGSSSVYFSSKTIEAFESSIEESKKYIERCEIEIEKEFKDESK